MSGAVPRATLAVDIGGTFTDAVLSTVERIFTAKVLTTPTDPVVGFIAAVRRVLDDAHLDPSAVGRVLHGTTLATNVILERRGAPIALITTDGYRALLALGRDGRVEAERYDLWGTQAEPVVPLSHTFEVRGRILADGIELAPFDESDARRVAHEIAALGVAGVAICMLNSYVDDAHERRMAAICREAMGEDVAIVTSASVLPEMREFERMTTTVMSAYVGPVMSAYLRSLADALGGVGVGAPISVMESAGGVMPAALAASLPVHTIESGPAAGVVAAARVGRDCGLSELVAFDMGGTTAKAALIRGGRPDITHDFIVGGKGSFGGRRSGSGIPIKIPAIDLAEVGSGGGSIAWIDPSGALRVGPRSAGAAPGPACYGLGGIDPTVTDANLVLGYLSASTFAGGSMPLDVAAAMSSITARIADPLGVTVQEAAFAIHQIANADMAAAIHVVTVQRGIDPRRFALVATGGAAAMHACRIAARFDMRSVIVPPHAGVASAVGLVRTDLFAQRSRTLLVEMSSADPARIDAVFEALIAMALSDLAVERDAAMVERFAAMRFSGQAHELDVQLGDGPVDDELLERLVQSFLSDYQRAFGIDARGPVQLVSFRTHVRLPVDAPYRNEVSAATCNTRTARRVWFAPHGHATDTPVVSRADLAVGPHGDGPLIVESGDSTVVVPPGWTCDVHVSGALVLRLGEGGR
jgi:N-methylhydantoinase A